jgi:hypothetical protein
MRRRQGGEGEEIILSLLTLSMVAVSPKRGTAIKITQCRRGRRSRRGYYFTACSGRTRFRNWRIGFGGVLFAAGVLVTDSVVTGKKRV